MFSRRFLILAAVLLIGDLAAGVEPAAGVEYVAAAIQDPAEPVAPAFPPIEDEEFAGTPRPLDLEGVMDEPAGGRTLRRVGAGALLLLALIGAGLFGYRHRAGRGGRRTRVARESDEGGWPLQPLIVPPGLASRSAAGAAYRAGGPAPALRGPPPPPALHTPPATPSIAAGPPQLAVVSGSASAARPRTMRGRDSALARQTPEPEEVHVGHVHFHRPPEGTLQLLPGKLEILGGAEGVDEMRFVRVPGREPVVTFGRSDGEPHTHIRLEARTVSRLHAALRYQNGQWHLENRSRTNPALVNGVALPASGGAPLPLADGDTIEMGEVAFRFRMR